MFIVLEVSRQAIFLSVVVVNASRFSPEVRPLCYLWSLQEADWLLCGNNILIGNHSDSPFLIVWMCCVSSGPSVRDVLCVLWSQCEGCVVFPLVPV